METLYPFAVVNLCGHYRKHYEVPTKNKNKTTISSSNPTSVYISEGNEITISKELSHLHVYCSIISSSQDIGNILSVHDGWLDKENVKKKYVYKILFSHTKSHLWQRGWNLREC